MDFEPNNHPPEDPAQTYKRLQKWVMHLLSRKNYSRLELKDKLQKRYSVEMVRDVLIWAEEKKWLLDERENAQRTAQLLHERNKGQLYITNHLKKRGLPLVHFSEEDESAKAMALLQGKWPNLQELWQECSSYAEKQKLKAKLLRFLVSRGYKMNIAQKAIHSSTEHGTE